MEKQTKLESPEVIPQQHNWLSKKLIGAEIQPIPDERPDSQAERNFISRYTFTWLDHILRVGYDRILVFQDVPKLASKDRIELRIKEYHKYIDNKPKDKNYVEIFGILYAFRKLIFWVCFLQACSYGSSVGQSVISRNLITAAELIETAKGRTSHGPAAGYTIGNTILNLISSSTSLISSYMEMLLTKQVRTLAIAAIHEKVMSMSPQQRMDFSAGKITAIITSDTTRGSQVFMYLGQLLLFPIYLGVVTGVLIYNLGVSALAGMAILFLGLVFNMGSAVFAGKLRFKSMPFQDKRVSLIRETVKNMSIIKLYGWEDSFLKVIAIARAAEAKYVRLIALVTSVTNSLVLATPIFAGALSFAVRILIGKQLNPAQAFPSLTLFNLLLPIVAIITMATNSFADTWVACKRMNNLFRLPSTSPYIETLSAADPTSHGVAFTLDDVTLGWDTTISEEDESSNAKPPGDSKEVDKSAKVTEVPDVPEAPEVAELSEVSEAATGIPETTSKAKNKIIRKTILSNVNVTIRNGTFNLVVGPVGSGKTSLLSTFVGNIPLNSGHVVKTEGQTVSCVLSHWARNATVRDNILFGREWDSSLYDQVIHVCDLHSDFEQFVDGDLTEIGENGITLSGGQRARLALARALYADCSVIVLDDVLSAMDARVGNLIFGELLKLVRTDGKTIIFSTNNLTCLPYADTVMTLDGHGKCTQESPSEVRIDYVEEKKPSKHQRSVDEWAEEEKEKIAKTNTNVDGVTGTSNIVGSNLPLLSAAKSPGGILKALADETGSIASAERNPEPEKHRETTKLVVNESRAMGTVKLSVLARYFRLDSLLGVCLAIIALILAVVFGTSAGMQNVVLSWWTGDKFHKSQGFNIGMYCMVVAIYTVAYVCVANLVAYYCTSSTSHLFIKALRGVYQAPMVFFQQNPLGRILTRFTEDVVNLDTRMLMFARALFLLIMRFLGSIIVVFVYVPWSIICMAPMLLMAAMFMAFYRTASRELNRVNQLCESKTMTAVSENIEGQDVISAFEQKEQATSLIMERFNDLFAAYMCNEGTHFWIALRVVVLCEILTLVTIFLAVFQVIKLSASSVGMLISTLASVAETLSMIIPVLANFENQLNSVERLEDYARNIESEQDGADELPELEDWRATDGFIRFEDVSLRYREDLPLALDRLSLEIGGGKRLGICGRTGAGKSTIVSATFRLVQLSSGQITIDGQPIHKIPLKTLRRVLTIIPQQPVLFQGTIRSNLDPFDEKTDQELWDALNRAGKLNERDNTKFHLDSKVDTDGTNFSLGERQMLSLARALVRQSKILIMDEATAAVDEEMDDTIQEIIRTQFSHCTVICIAHRLRTIINYDEVMVLAPGGKLIEKGSPQKLLASNGEFAALAKEAGILKP